MEEVDYLVAFALVSKRFCSRAVTKDPERVPIENKIGLLQGNIIDKIRIAVNTANATELRYGVKQKVNTPLYKIQIRVGQLEHRYLRSSATSLPEGLRH